MATLIGIGLCCLFGAMAASSMGWIPNEEDSSIPGFLFSGAIFVVACYGTAAYCLNSSVVDVSTKRILVRSEPLPGPYPRRRTLRTSDVVQLFVEHALVCVPQTGEFSNGGDCAVYSLCALVQGGERIPLVNFKGEEGMAIARLIEQEVAEYLGIQDGHAEGEEFALQEDR